MPYFGQTNRNVTKRFKGQKSTSQKPEAVIAKLTVSMHCLILNVLQDMFETVTDLASAAVVFVHNITFYICFYINI